MTIQDASLSLINWFSSHDYFNTTTSICQIIDEKKWDEDSQTAAILCALDYLERQNLISRSPEPYSHIWVVNKNMGEVKQSVELSLSTFAKIAQILTSYEEIFGDESSEGIDVSEHSILKLIQIIEILSKSLSEINIDKNFSGN